MTMYFVAGGDGCDGVPGRGDIRVRELGTLMMLGVRGPVEPLNPLWETESVGRGCKGESLLIIKQLLTSSLTSTLEDGCHDDRKYFDAFTASLFLFHRCFGFHRVSHVPEWLLMWSCWLAELAVLLESWLSLHESKAWVRGNHSRSDIAPRCQAEVGSWQ